MKKKWPCCSPLHLFITFFILIVVFGTLCFVETNDFQQQLFIEQKECQKSNVSPVVRGFRKALALQCSNLFLFNFNICTTAALTWQAKRDVG